MNFITLAIRNIACRRKPWCGLSLLLALVPSTTMAAPDEDPSRNWIDRPWEFRYVIRIESPYDYERWRKFGQNELDKGDVNATQAVEPIFPLSTSILTDPEDGARERNRAIGTLLVTFNQNAEVASPYSWPHKLNGHLNRIRNLVLASGNRPQDMQFRLGEWYTGRSDAEIAYIPAICSMTHGDDARYKKGFSAKSYSTNGNFGCREWGYYLQSDKHPYIDVTSYGKDEFGSFSYIRPVIGWGRFDVPSKPVIGKHGKVWVCLHECPNGEAPGIIPDVKAWAKANGWPVPKPPKKQPMFPDREFKHGEFID